MQKASTMATGSLRRKAQWLHRYPHHHVVNLRGNVKTRMDKLFTSKWEGAIFAKAGIERLELVGSYFQELKWMIPAPAQGAIGLFAGRGHRTDRTFKKINHQPPEMC